MPPAPAAGAPAALRAGGSGGPAAGGAEPRHPDVRELMSDECGALMHSPHTLQLLLEQGELRTVDPADVDWNIENCTEEYYQGGEAAVHIVCWHNRGAAKPINDGLRIALKVYHCPGDSGGFKPVANEDDVVREAYIAQRMQRKEVNVLDILRRVGCSDCIPTLQAVFQRAGNLQELPLYGYAMTAYQHGSLARYLRHTCAGLAPEGEFASFFGPAKLAAHYSRLHDILCRLSCAEVPDHLAELLPPLSPRAAAALGAPARPRRRGLLLQDISSNNLLVQETLPKGCTLLFSDPSRAELMDSLESPNAERYITATWMWGCMAAQHRIVDETADVYSTNICMLEVWAVAEGAPIPLDQLIDTLGVANDRAKGVTFARSLCTAMLKRHVLGSKSCGIVPRIRRELPLSWLMLWSILLGCDDFHSTGELKSGRRHRRPSVADMADVASQLAAVATQMEALEGGVSAAALDTPAGAALVEQCVQLYSRLAALTRLDDPTLLPADASLRWVATRFLQQDHPLVAAMKAQDDLAVISNDCCTLPKATATIFYFQSALLEAQKEAGWESGEQVFAVYHPTVEALCKEYRELQLEVLRLAPPGSELAQLVRDRDAGLPANVQRFMAQGLEGGFLPRLPEPPAVTADATQLPPAACSGGAGVPPAQPCTAAAPPQLAQLATSLAAAVAVQSAEQTAALAAGLARNTAPAVPAVPAGRLQQPAQQHAVPASHPAAAPLQLAGPPVVLAQQPGAQPCPPAALWPAAHPVAAYQLGPSADQAAPCGQPALPLLHQQVLLGGQAPDSQQTAILTSPRGVAASPSAIAPASALWPGQFSAGFAFGASPHLELWPAAPDAQLLTGYGLWHATTAGAAGRTGSTGPPVVQAAAAPSAAPCQPESPSKKRRLGQGGSSASRPPASPAPPPVPKPRAFCGLFAEPGPAVAGQPAEAAPPLPEWLRQLRDGGLVEAAAELDTLARLPQASSAAPSAAQAACSPALSSEGRRMAAALAAGFRLKDDTQLSYKRADVERYADALQRLILSELPPPGLEAQHALFRPINTAAKLAWFLGWWASKDRNAPRIPGLGMDFSTNGKSDRTKAVLDAAEEDGVFSGTISVAYGRTMPYAAQALLRRLLVSRPLFAAAVVEEMQEM